MRAVCPTCNREFEPGTPTCPDDGERLLIVGPDPIAQLVGKMLDGRFRVDQLLGQGGMGAVYVGTQVSVGRQVAIKVIQPGQIADADTVKRFHREAQIISRLAHSHTVHLIDFGQTEHGLLYLVMEYVRGRSLSRDIAMGPMPPPRAGAIVAQVCDALAEAHTQGIVHRDLKPDNILLTSQAGSEDFVKILDFGIAKVAGQTDRAMSTLTEVGSIVGTPQYMSPEQISGSDSLTARSDLYSLTVILFELLAGRAPFVDESPMSLLIKHLQNPPPKVAEVFPACRISRDVEEFIARNLAKDPTQRAKDAVEYKAELQRAFAASARASRPLPQRPAVPAGAGEQPTLPFQRQPEPVPTSAYAPPTPAAMPAQPSAGDLVAPSGPSQPLPAGKARSRVPLYAGAAALATIAAVATALLVGKSATVRADSAPALAAQGRPEPAGAGQAPALAPALAPAPALALAPAPAPGPVPVPAAAIAAAPTPATPEPAAEATPSGGVASPTSGSVRKPGGSAKPSARKPEGAAPAGGTDDFRLNER